jgi:hypothetical protein
MMMVVVDFAQVGFSDEGANPEKTQTQSCPKQ